MKHLTTIAITLIAACVVPARAEPENVYRCGNSYSQTPCPNGTQIDVHDTRTPQQKAEADDATHRNADAAKSLEKTRLQEEARQWEVARQQAVEARAAAAAAAAAEAQKQATAPTITVIQVAPRIRNKQKEPANVPMRSPAADKPQAPASKSR